MMDFPLKGRVVSKEEIENRTKDKMFAVIEYTQTPEGLLKLNSESQKSIRLRTHRLMPFFYSIPRLSFPPKVKENEDEHFILVRYVEGTPTHNLEFKNGKYAYSMPHIPVIGLIVEKANLLSLLEEVKNCTEFNNVIEVEYFDDESFLDIPVINKE